MDPTELKELCIQSCKDMFEQMTVMQESADVNDNKISTVINDLIHMKNFGDYWELKLSKKLHDTDRIALRIYGADEKEHDDFFSGDVRFDEYDEFSMTIRAFVSDKLDRLLRDKEAKDVKIISDMKWLITLTEESFTEFGDRLGYPKYAPDFDDGDYEFPKFKGGKEPTDEQRKAVHTILNNKLSYVWGAPGTGKTQFVLATAIIAHIKRGGRVAIFAPTNNSVEQVLRGVIDVLRTDDPDHTYIDPDKDILRLGTATSEFMKKYKNICEDKSISAEISKIDRTLQNFDKLQMEGEIDFLRPTFEDIHKLLNEIDSSEAPEKKKELSKELEDDISTIKKISDRYEYFRTLVSDLNSTTVKNKIKSLEKQFFDRDMTILERSRYSTMSDEDVEKERKDLKEKREELSKKETSNRIKSVKIMAMTPYIMMARRKALFSEDGLIDVDQIFIDEVGYCNLIQTLPIFMCGPPIAMLGDHMQLPPVCELDREMIIDFYTNPNPDGFMMNGFMWDQSALNVESYLDGDIKKAAELYIGESEPLFDRIIKADLTRSHRFSDNLAQVLNRCVYKNGITGLGKDNMEVYVIDRISQYIRTGTRKNPEEAKAVSDYVAANSTELKEFVILTPYREQRTAIEKMCPNYKDNIMTIHSSQGREWDTVIISICDDDRTDKPVPLRFTSSVEGNKGLKVMNTAISRAKKKLVIVCSYDFWLKRAEMGDLLGELVKEAELIDI